MKSPLEVLRLYPEHDYTLAGAFASHEQSDPDRPFLSYEQTKWTWRSFGSAVTVMASGLAARGIGKGDRVAFMARNSDGHALMLLALARLGAIMVPINPEFGTEEARYVFN